MSYSHYFNDIPTFARFDSDPIPTVPHFKPRPVSFPPVTIPKLVYNTNTFEYLKPGMGLYRFLNFQFRNKDGFVKTANLYKILCKPKYISQHGFYELVFNSYINHLYNQTSNITHLYSRNILNRYLSFLTYVGTIKANVRSKKINSDYDYYVACAEIVKQFVRIFSRQ